MRISDHLCIQGAYIEIYDSNKDLVDGFGNGKPYLLVQYGVFSVSVNKLKKIFEGEWKAMPLMT